MKADTIGQRQIEFYFADIDTHVLVENLADGPVIHATRNSFSEARKSRFVRQLAAEGHIPDRYEWFCQANSSEPQSVRWVIDRSWARLDPAIRPRAERRVLMLLLCSAVVWALFLALLFFRHSA